MKEDIVEIMKADAVFVNERYVGTMYPVDGGYTRVFCKDGTTNLFNEPSQATCWMTTHAYEKGLI